MFLNQEFVNNRFFNGFIVSDMYFYQELDDYSENTPK